VTGSLATSSERTQAFLLVGTLVLLPVILMYSGWSYWVFRGKVHSDIGYHSDPSPQQQNKKGIQ
jgi:cytochrome bd-type quinol oxidase subunit 2